MEGVLKVLDMLGHTITNLQAQIADLQRENQQLRATLMAAHQPPQAPVVEPSGAAHNDQKIVPK